VKEVPEEEKEGAMGAPYSESRFTLG